MSAAFCTNISLFYAHVSSSKPKETRAQQTQVQFNQMLSFVLQNDDHQNIMESPPFFIYTTSFFFFFFTVSYGLLAGWLLKPTYNLYSTKCVLTILPIDCVCNCSARIFRQVILDLMFVYHPWDCMMLKGDLQRKRAHILAVKILPSKETCNLCKHAVLLKCYV